ncbi:ribonuclease H-like domain-containing protein [Tanacetum coccineum]
MDLETAQLTTTTKFPTLKQENGNSFKLASKTTTNADGTSTTLIPGPYKDAKTLFAAIQTRFGGNEATKKTQKTLLKQITNEVNTAYGVSTANTQVSLASTQVSAASTEVSTANLSDDTMSAFLASQPNRSQLLYEDLEQIHEDEIEEMDLKWQLALLSMRTRRFFQKTGRKITNNGSDTARYDKSKVECFNCHKMGHFAREYRGLRNKDNGNRNQDSSRRTVNVEEISSKAMLAIDGAGFDWSYMADDEVPTNMAFMAFLDSEVHNDKTCSKTCLKSFEILKTQPDDLRIEFNKSEFNLANYKRGLASVEEQLVFYKKNEVIFYEQLAVIKRDISYKDLEISVFKGELENLKQEKESNQLKIENFDNASKSLDKLISGQIPDKSRKGMSFDHVQANCNYHQMERVVSENNYTRVNYNYSTKKAHPSAHKNMAPRAVLMKPSLRPLNTARPINIAHPKTIGHPQKEDQGYVNSGCSRHMTCNMSYLSDLKEFDGGY